MFDANASATGYGATGTGIIPSSRKMTLQSTPVSSERNSLS
jgi:hypothetical protein